MSDLLALPTEEDRMKARGFVERAGMVICGGLPAAEIPMLTSAVGMSRAERNLVTSWTTPPAWDSTLGDAGAPPGQGKFLIKVGGRPGIPLRVTLTPVEAALNDTNKKWHDVDPADVIGDALDAADVAGGAGRIDLDDVDNPIVSAETIDLAAGERLAQSLGDQDAEPSSAQTPVRVSPEVSP